MKPADVERAQHELTRLKELEDGLRVVREDGLFFVRTSPHGAGRHGPEFLHISAGRKEGYGHLVTPNGLPKVKEVVAEAYETEIAKAKERLAKLGIEVEGAKAA